MRKRNVQILFRLNEEEADYLYDLVKRSGRSKEELLRSMVKGYRLCEKPDPEFYQIMRELSAIGNRINQLAVKANALDFVDTPMLREEAKKWQQFHVMTVQRRCPITPKPSMTFPKPLQRTDRKLQSRSRCVSLCPQ